MTVPNLTLADAARTLRDALKDKSYRSTPLGLEVARYVRWFRSEWGATPESVRDYEAILAKLCLHFADLELRDFETPIGTERLREFLDERWGDKSPRTKKKVRSVWIAFFDWAIREGRGIHGNPARVLASPKVRGVKREPFGSGMVAKVIAAQDYLADKLGCILVLLYGLRRAELAGVRFADFDFERRTVTVTGKGGKVRTVEIVEPAFWRDLGALELELGGRAVCRDWFLLYRSRQIGMTLFRWHQRGLVPRTVGGGWWYGCLRRAEIVVGDRDEGGWSGFGMHRGRHTVASEVIRGSGNIVAASKILGHSDISTTEAFYSNFDTHDAAQVLRALRAIEDE